MSHLQKKATTRRELGQAPDPRTPPNEHLRSPPARGLLLTGPETCSTPSEPASARDHSPATPQRTPPRSSTSSCVSTRSASSDACLPYARFIGDAFGAKVTLLHVIPSASKLHEDTRADALAWELAKREANIFLEAAKRTLGTPSDRTAVRLTQGQPAEQIIAAARELATDLTILSSHGDRGQGPLDPGSVTHHVLALATEFSPAGGARLRSANATASDHGPARRGSMRGESALPIVADLARASTVPRCCSSTW